MRLSTAIAIVLGTTGCRQILGIESGTVGEDGQVHRDSGLDADDAPYDDAIDAPDMMIDAPPIAPWTNITLVPDLATGDQDPTLTGDMLEMYFARGNNAIYVMTRADLASAWTTPQVASFSNAGMNHSPEISRDGLIVVFSSDRGPNGTQLDVYYSVRSTRTSPWSAPLPFADVNNASADERPGSGSLDAARITLSSNRGGTSVDLYESTRSGGVGLSYGAPVRMPISSLLEEDSAPALSDDGLTLYYSSGIPVNGLKLYVSTRPSLSAQFIAGTAITELNTGNANTDPWVSSDGRVIYFASDRGDGIRIYHASR